MAEAGPQAPDIPAPPLPPAQPHPTQQQAITCTTHMANTTTHTTNTPSPRSGTFSWSHFKPEFSGKPEEEAELICLELMIG